MDGDGIGKDLFISVKPYGVQVRTLHILLLA